MMKNILLGGAMIFVMVPGILYAKPVLFISIDGLQPSDVIEADKRGIKLPNLRRFITEGSYASGVVGVLPTVTYPSHATLMTGAAPARHGIYSNTTFDPKQINQGGWYWYASDYKLPTLWGAAAKAGLSTANVHWPVSVDEKSIRWNIPQIWRTGHGDDAKLVNALATPGLIQSLEKQLGAYVPGIDESIEGDENRGAFAAALIARENPDFTTVYLTALDHEQHASGPDTKAAYAVLERIDTIIGKLVTAEMAVRPDAVIAVASDHGFAKTDTEINLFRAFIDAGLIILDGEGKVASWDAMPWPSGGSCAVVLVRPDDEGLNKKVSDILAKLKSDPAARIAAIADRKAIAAMGGNPDASFYVDLQAGAYWSGFKGNSVPLASPSKSKGMHGYFPANSKMRSSFMMMGKGVAKGKNWGEIDMRSIAPTLARTLDAKLPDAEMPPLP